MKHLKVMVTLHNSMQYCQYLCMHIAISPAQKKCHENFEINVRLAFVINFLNLVYEHLILATKYRRKIRAQWCSD